MKSYNLNPTLKYLKIKIFHFYSTLLFLHLPLGNAAGAGLAAALTGALQFQLARAGGAVEAVVQFLAERAACQVAVYLPFPLAVAAHHNTAGYMGQVNAIIRFVHLLATLATASHKFLLQIIFVHTKTLHHILQFLQFFRRNGHTGIVTSAGRFFKPEFFTLPNYDIDSSPSGC